jgi:hypothetical protein
MGECPLLLVIQSLGRSEKDAHTMHGTREVDVLCGRKWDRNEGEIMLLMSVRQNIFKQLQQTSPVQSTWWDTTSRIIRNCSKSILLINGPHVSESFWWKWQPLIWFRNFPLLMVPKGSSYAHMSPPLFSKLNQLNPLHNNAYHYFKVRFSITLPIYAYLPRGLFPERSPKKIMYVLLIALTRAARPAHLMFLDFTILIILGEKYKLQTSFLPIFHPVTSPVSGPYVLLSIMFWTTPVHVRFLLFTVMCVKIIVSRSVA